MAEYFRDVKNQDVLLFIDNIFRFVQAGSEVSTLLGRMPSAVGYQPTLADEMGQLQERITSTKESRSPRSRRCTSRRTTTPTRHRSRRSPTSTPRRRLSRPDRRTYSIYPAGRPLAWASRVLAPEIVGDRHYAVARRTMQESASSATRSCKTSSPSSEWRSSPKRTEGDGEPGPQKCSSSSRRVLHRREVFTGVPGIFVPIDETVESFEALANGDLDHVPEQAFLGVGGVDTVLEEAGKGSRPRPASGRQRLRRGGRHA